MSQSVEEKLGAIDQAVDAIFQQLNQPNVAQTIAGVVLSNIIVSNRIAQLTMVLRGEVPEVEVEAPVEAPTPTEEVPPVDTDAV